MTSHMIRKPQEQTNRTNSHEMTRNHLKSQQKHSKIATVDFYATIPGTKYQQNLTKRPEFTRNHDEITIQAQQTTQNYAKYQQNRTIAYSSQRNPIKVPPIRQNYAKPEELIQTHPAPYRAKRQDGKPCTSTRKEQLV